MNEPPGRASARRAGRPHRGGVLPRSRRPGRASLHRQHLPLRPGGLRGLGAPRPYAERRGLPAHPGQRDGRAPGAHHLHQARLGDLGAGHLRAGRRPHRPGAGRHASPTSTPPPCSPAPISEKGIYPAVDPLDSSSRILDARRRGRRALRGRPARAGDPPALPRAAGHHRHPRHGRALRRGQGQSCSAPARSSASSASRSPSPRRSPARRASTSSSPTPSAASRTSCEGKCDDLPEQAFFMVGGIEEAAEKAKTLAGAEA